VLENQAETAQVMTVTEPGYSASGPVSGAPLSAGSPVSEWVKLPLFLPNLRKFQQDHDQLYLQITSTVALPDSQRTLIVYILRIAIVFFVLATAACATTEPLSEYIVSINSITYASTPEGIRYVLMPANEGTTSNDLEFKEYAGYISRALQSRGFTLADNAENADAAIFVAYGVGDPQETEYSYKVPVWGYTGVSPSRTVETTTTFGRSVAYTATRTYRHYGITGYQTQEASFTTYSKFIVLDAFNLAEFQQNQKEDQLWRIIITSTGTSSDLRRFFPYMVAASEPYIVRNTNQQVTVTVDQNTPAVRDLKGQGREETKQ
jgi:hypothetical protein